MSVSSIRNGGMEAAAIVVSVSEVRRIDFGLGNESPKLKKELEKNLGLSPIDAEILQDLLMKVRLTFLQMENYCALLASGWSILCDSLNGCPTISAWIANEDFEFSWKREFERGNSGLKMTLSFLGAGKVTAIRLGKRSIAVDRGKTTGFKVHSSEFKKALELLEAGKCVGLEIREDGVFLLGFQKEREHLLRGHPWFPQNPWLGAHMDQRRSAR